MKEERIMEVDNGYIVVNCPAGRSESYNIAPNLKGALTKAKDLLTPAPEPIPAAAQAAGISGPEV